MKNAPKFMFMMGFMLLITTLKAQSPIAYHNMEVTWNKTTSIIFPCGITTVDRGSRNLLAQKAKGVTNVLQLKAGQRHFPETNLTVITTDGTLHHFTVKYADAPEQLALSVSPSTGQEPPASPSLIFLKNMTISEMKACAEAIVGKKPQRFPRKVSKNDMTLTLQGIYIQNDVMFYHLTIENDSNIPYDTERLRCYIKDRQKVKRTASQEVPINPLYHYGDDDRIPAQSTRHLIYALPKCTIPNAKHLAIELMEHNGGRHLTLTIPNKQIIKAKSIN